MNSFDLFGNPTGEQTIQEGRRYHAPSFVLPVGEESEDQVETEQPTPRNFIGLRIGVFLILGAIGLQCYKLQVSQARENEALAQGNSARIITLPADRGLISDIGGTILAQNNRQLALAIDPTTLPIKLSERQAVYRLLQQKAQISDDTISLIETNRLKSPDVFPIKTRLTKDESLLYKEEFASTPGVIMQESPIRTYASLPSLGQLLGYVGQANEEDLKNGHTLNQQVGQSGLEAVYDIPLDGTPGKQEVTVDASGQIVSSMPTTVEQETKPGNTLKLSLDSALQKSVASALQEAITQRTKIFGDKSKSLGASAVILDATNGAIKAMVSLPDYDANMFSGGISQKDYQTLLDNPSNPLLNRTIQGQYPSGSVVKPLIAAAALQNGTISANRTLDTPAAITIGPYTFPDWKPHGLSDVRKAIAQSNDIFFYALGGGWPEQGIAGMGIDKLNQALNKFGLGSKTGVDLPGEVAGLTPGPEWKQVHVGEPWYIGDTYHQSIGQGYLLVTPLQMAAATAAIANGGTLYQPQLGWSEIDPTTNKETLLSHKVLDSNWISPENLAVVQQGMQMTTQSGGTAQLLAKLATPSAGKTGTAEFGSDGLTHSWYTGYAPVDHPQYAFAILIEGDGNVTEATEGSEPVAEEILRAMFNEPLQPGQPLYTQALLPTATSTTSTPTPNP